MSDKLPRTTAEIEKKIYLIRNQRVMLDRDLAEIYGLETRTMNQSVKRNIERFPQDFMFQLDETEAKRLRNSSQFVMSRGKHRGKSYRPFVFTEHGAVMLSSVLRTRTATSASIVVVRAFIKIRTVLLEHLELTHRIEELESSVDLELKNQNEKIKALFTAIRHLISGPTKPRSKIGFVREPKA